MSSKKSVSKCTQVDTELVGSYGSRGPSPGSVRGPSPSGRTSRVPPRHQRRLRRTYSDGHHTSEEYLLHNSTMDSSFTEDQGMPSYSYNPHKYSTEPLVLDSYGNPYPHQPELVCNCVQSNYFYTSSTLPREKKHDPFYFSDQNISGRTFHNRSSEELIVSQRSLDRKFKPKSQLSLSDRKTRTTRTLDRRANNISSKFDANFLPVSKERSLDGEIYQLRNFNREACSPSRCAHSIYSGVFHTPKTHVSHCRKYNGYGNNFGKDTFDSHMYGEKCDGTCQDFFMDEYEAGKACARSLPPHFGNDDMRRDVLRDGEMRPRKSWERLGGRRVIVPDGCEQDDTFEMMYSGCQCERCDHAGYPGGYCHHNQESTRPASRQSQSVFAPLGAPPRALAPRPPSLTSTSTGTSSTDQPHGKHDLCSKACQLNDDEADQLQIHDSEMDP